MPSARIHEVIALKVNEDYKMDETLLRLGTISPDCWRNVNPNSKFHNKYLTHFWNHNIKEGQANDYTIFYIKYYNYLTNPFYFGYLIHLITDQYWKTYIDPKYFFSENGINKCKLKDGRVVEDKDNLSYHESIRLQKKLYRKYNLSLLPLNKEEIPNFECNIEEIDLTGLFGPNGSINYVNTKVIPTTDIEEKLEIYNLNDIEKYIDETVLFIKQELKKLKQIKKYTKSK